ncbi:MAG: 50S ribosomal protein L13 [Microgenomates bacterium 39_7]|nr:MAG: 50S ribosomal protein L13 [Microgenomates bacterium 39_7]
MKQHKTFMQKSEDVERKWHLVDVEDKVLGRVATEIAELLIGKSKPTYTPHVDGGDYVVVTNAAKVAVTGNKGSDKIYRWHTGFAGGLKEIAFNQLLTKSPEKIIQKAVRNMLPKNRLQRLRMNRLKVFVDDQHPYQNELKREAK